MKKIITLLSAFLVVLFFTSCVYEQSHNNEISDSTEKDVLLSSEEIYMEAVDSTVSVTCESSTSISVGTGFVYKESGMIATNYHVIKGYKTGYITCEDGGKYDLLAVLGFNEDLDIALLSTSYKRGNPLPVRIEPVKTGEKVYTLGNSLGLGMSFSEGVISSASRLVEGNDFIQITAPISEGNSGGPLFDENGYLIGITTAAFENGQNMNLAVPIMCLEKMELLDIPISMKQMLAETDSFETLKNYILENGNETRYVGDYSLSFETKSPYNTLGEVVELLYHRESPYESPKEAIQFVLKYMKGTSCIYNLTITIQRDDSKCWVDSCLVSDDEEFLAQIVANVEIDDLPNIEYGDLEIIPEEGYAVSDDQISESVKEIIVGLEDIIGSFDTWTNRRNVGCSASDFGFVI